MVKKKSVKEMTGDLIFHMLDNGWSVNHEYLGNFKKEDVDLEALMMGKDKNKNHLSVTIGEEVFVAKFENKRLKVWRMKPSWKKIGNFPIGQIKLIENGIIYEKQIGIVSETVKIIVPKET